MKTLKRLWLAFPMLMLAVALIACSAPSKPTIALTPIAGQITEGQEVTFQSIANDAKGISRVEFSVDNVVVMDSDVRPPQKSIAVAHKWVPLSGNHLISVRAVNMENAMSEEAALAISVSALPGPAPTTAAPTNVAPTRVAVVSTPTHAPAACTNSAKFISDVNVPDGTRFLPNQGFLKTWRVQNTGTCTWSSKYSLVFATGELMGGVREIPVPGTVAPSNTVDLSVQQTAPNGYGLHEGRWQLRDPNGALFGSLIIRIDVVSPQPTACVPQISSFTVDRPTINRGESTVLRWGTVANAQRVEIDNGIGGVGTPGTHTVAPSQSTTYNLRATCGGNTVAKSVTVVVNQPAPQPTPVPPQPTRRNVSGSWHAGEYVLDLSEALGCSGSDCPVAGTIMHAVMPAPEIENVSGSINVYNGAMQLAIERPGAGGLNCNVNASSSQMTCSGFFGTLSFTK